MHQGVIFSVWLTPGLYLEMTLLASFMSCVGRCVQISWCRGTDWLILLGHAGLHCSITVPYLITLRLLDISVTSISGRYITLIQCSTKADISGNTEALPTDNMARDPITIYLFALIYAHTWFHWALAIVVLCTIMTGLQQYLLLFCHNYNSVCYMVEICTNHKAEVCYHISKAKEPCLC